jgi:hypothetical protein
MVSGGVLYQWSFVTAVLVFLRKYHFSNAVTDADVSTLTSSTWKTNLVMIMEVSPSYILRGGSFLFGNEIFRRL